MGFPVPAKKYQGFVWKWNIPVFGSFAAVDEEHHPGTIDVRYLQIQRFLQPQATGVDGGEEDEVVKGGNLREGRVNCLCGRDFGKPFFPLRFEN